MNTDGPRVQVHIGELGGGKRFECGGGGWLALHWRYDAPSPLSCTSALEERGAACYQGCGEIDCLRPLHRLAAPAARASNLPR